MSLLLFNNSPIFHHYAQITDLKHCSSVYMLMLSRIVPQKKFCWNIHTGYATICRYVMKANTVDLLGLFVSWWLWSLYLNYVWQVSGSFCTWLMMWKENRESWEAQLQHYPYLICGRMHCSISPDVKTKLHLLKSVGIISQYKCTNSVLVLGWYSMMFNGSCTSRMRLSLTCICEDFARPVHRKCEYLALELWCINRGLWVNKKGEDWLLFGLHFIRLSLQKNLHSCKWETIFSTIH